ncbi:MAG: transposase [Phycisphaerales bacterium]|nr:transposase [Phycisphaerales bacterium]
MDLRQELVRQIRREGVSVSAAARVFGVSRKTAHKWLSRFDEDGKRGLVDRSRAPRSRPNATAEDVVEALTQMRRRHRTWGGEKIRDRLVLDGWDPGDLPAVSTIGSILKREGLVHARRKRPPTAPGSGQGALSAGPNDLWTTDFKGDFKLGDGSRCYPLTIQDHSSRYVLSVRAMEGTTSATARKEFRRVFQAYGVPKRIHSDNGVPFAAPGFTGLSHLAVDWMKQDIVIERSRPACPQDNGAHERMHRDLKTETARPPCRTARGQQHRFTRWMRERNEYRPSRALDGQTPASVYESTAREYQANPHPWEYAGHWETAKVKPNGMIRWGEAEVFLSASLRGERVGLVEIDDGIWELWYRRTQLGLLNDRLKRRARAIVPNPWWVTRPQRASRATH